MEINSAQNLRKAQGVVDYCISILSEQDNFTPDEKVRIVSEKLVSVSHYTKEIGLTPKSLMEEETFKKMRNDKPNFLDQIKRLQQLSKQFEKMRILMVSHEPSTPIARGSGRSKDFRE